MKASRKVVRLLIFSLGHIHFPNSHVRGLLGRNQDIMTPLNRAYQEQYSYLNANLEYKKSTAA